MKTKNLLVFFLAIVSVLLVGTVSAATNQLADINSIKIDGVNSCYGNIAVTAGETATVQVVFTALESASNVNIQAELNGQKNDASAVIGPLDLEQGMVYTETLNVNVPYEVTDNVSEDMGLDLKIWNGDYTTENTDTTLRVQRPSYNVNVLSVSMDQNVNAGDNVPIDVVLQNNGYDNLDNMYVTLKIAELGVEKTSFFGDLVPVADNNNDDTVTGRFYLQIPFDAKAGVYSLDVEAKNGDIDVSGTKQIVITNDVPEDVIIANAKQSANVGQNVDYSVLLVNPTNNLKVYSVIVQPTADVVTSTSTGVVAVPAGLSKTVTVTAKATSQGEHDFNVQVFSGENLVSTTPLSLTATGSSVNAIAALTVILALIFVVLLVVLLVMLRKKPEKKDDFGESYY